MSKKLPLQSRSYQETRADTHYGRGDITILRYTFFSEAPNRLRRTTLLIRYLTQNAFILSKTESAFVMNKPMAYCR